MTGTANPDAARAPDPTRGTEARKPRQRDRLRRLAARWWLFTSRPMSLRAAWRLSGVDTRRIPAGSSALAKVWHWSNRTDRIMLFALVILAPTVLTGPLLWCAARPSRRWGLYVVVGALVVLFGVAAGG